MSNKEKLYHIVNVVAIPVTVLSGILSVRIGYMADANQISMSTTSVMSIASLLLMAITGVGAIWIVVSTVINENIRTLLRKGTKGIFKSYVGVIALFIILVLSSFFTLLWVIGLAVLVIYLFGTSSRALITNASPGKI